MPAKALKTWYAFQIQYLLTLFFVKISILAFYRRLSPAKGFQIAIKIVAGFVTVFTVTMVSASVKVPRKTLGLVDPLYADAVRKSGKSFPCSKLPNFAFANTKPKGCYDPSLVFYTQSAINIVSDIVIFLLPLPSVLSLQLSKRNRGTF